VFSYLRITLPREKILKIDGEIIVFEQEEPLQDPLELLEVWDCASSDV